MSGEPFERSLPSSKGILRVRVFKGSKGVWRVRVLKSFKPLGVEVRFQGSKFWVPNPLTIQKNVEFFLIFVIGRKCMWVRNIKCFAKVGVCVTIRLLL